MQKLLWRCSSSGVGQGGKFCNFSLFFGMFPVGGLPGPFTVWSAGAVPNTKETKTQTHQGKEGERTVHRIWLGKGDTTRSFSHSPARASWTSLSISSLSSDVTFLSLVASIPQQGAMSYACGGCDRVGQLQNRKRNRNLENRRKIGNKNLENVYFCWFFTYFREFGFFYWSMRSQMWGKSTVLLGENEFSLSGSSANFELHGEVHPEIAPLQSLCCAPRSAKQSIAGGSVSQCSNPACKHWSPFSCSLFISFLILFVCGFYFN